MCGGHNPHRIITRVHNIAYDNSISCQGTQKNPHNFLDYRVNKNKAQQLSLGGFQKQCKIAEVNKLHVTEHQHVL